MGVQINLNASFNSRHFCRSSPFRVYSKKHQTSPDCEYLNGMAALITAKLAKIQIICAI